MRRITWVFGSVPHRWRGGRLYLQRYWMDCRTPIYPLTVTGSVFSGAGGGAVTFLQKSSSRLWFLWPGHVWLGHTSPARFSPKFPAEDASGFDKRLPTPVNVLPCASFLATISRSSAGTRWPGEGVCKAPPRRETAGPRSWDAGAWHGRERMRGQPFVGRASPSRCAVSDLAAGRGHESWAGVWGGKSRW